MAINRSCASCNQSFIIEEEDLLFYEKISLVINGTKYKISPPTHCPDCRQQRRLAFCNERYLYRGICDLCHKSTLTQYPPHLKQPNYCRECWHSDQWDPCTYGQDFDFSRPFFEQIRALKHCVPAQTLDIDGTNVNSEYIHFAGSSKNCYLIFHADFCEDCYYGYGFKNDISCVDGFYNLHCELCYDCVDIHKCYDLKGSQDCIRCSSSAFLRDCVGCSHCFLSVGLRNKEYCFENKQLSKEEYEKRIASLDLGSYRTYQQCKARLKELEKNHPFKEFQGHNTEHSSGNHLYNCKNAKFCFDCEDVEDAKFCYQVVLKGKNIYDIYQYGTNLQQSYENAIVGANGYQLHFNAIATMNCSHLLYCWYMETSKHCFGCVSMHNKQYCILNKQYSKEEYNTLVPRIVDHMKKTGEWGEFFPISISLFGYNKTSAQMYYPLSENEAHAKGYPWDNYEPPQPMSENMIRGFALPDHIDDVNDDIVNAAIECEITKKLFKITPQELKFYRQQRLPLPRRSPDERHMDRFLKRNPRTLWNRACSKCNASIRTTYSPERPETIYCEKCYLQAIY